jgi:hypothetical protein
MAKLLKVELYLVDTNEEEQLDDETLTDAIAYGLDHYIAGCYLTKVGEIKERDIGEWSDDHKFNLETTIIEEYRKEFKGS